MRFLLAPGAAGADARLGAPSATHAPEVGTPGPLPANQHPGPGSDPHLVLQYCPISERVPSPIEQQYQQQSGALTLCCHATVHVLLPPTPPIKHPSTLGPVF
ncbi:unnamed protein product [Gadus morhua 'NCC']